MVNGFYNLTGKLQFSEDFLLSHFSQMASTSINQLVKVFTLLSFGSSRYDHRKGGLPKTMPIMANVIC